MIDMRHTSGESSSRLPSRPAVSLQLCRACYGTSNLLNLVVSGGWVSNLGQTYIILKRGYSSFDCNTAGSNDIGITLQIGSTTSGCQRKANLESRRKLTHEC